jgi:hypothetical protein
MEDSRSRCRSCSSNEALSIGSFDVGGGANECRGVGLGILEDVDWRGRDWEEKRKSGVRLGVGEFAFGLGDGAAEGLGGFDPFGDDGLGVGDGFFVGGSVGHAAGEFWDFNEEGLIFFAPVDDEFVSHVSRRVRWGGCFGGSWSGGCR